MLSVRLFLQQLLQVHTIERAKNNGPKVRTGSVQESKEPYPSSVSKGQISEIKSTEKHES